MTILSRLQIRAKEQLDKAIRGHPQPSKHTPLKSRNKTRILCARCQRLRLTDRFLDLAEGPHRLSGAIHPDSSINMITAQSLDRSCYLCTQFRPFLQDLAGKSTTNFYFDEQRVQNYGTRLTIAYPGSHARLHLFSTNSWEFWNPNIESHPTRGVAHCPLTLDTCFDGSSGPINASIPFEPDDVKTWITRCLAQHTASCSTPRDNPFNYKRLIDCEKLQLCMSDRPYVCLSYLWGIPTPGQGQMDLNSVAQLPSTISDAIKVTLSIGMRYLWVDRYCIDQDNADEKHSLIQNMDAIYNGAELTIVAASGSDPNYGLPGVSRLRQGLPTLNIGDHTLVAMQDPGDEIRNSQWNKRAWTYQEALLSRRRLVFTDTQMYFQCRAGYDLDGLDLAGVPPKNMPSFQAFPARGIGNDIFDVFHRIQEYYTRSASFDTDIINAFSGTFRAFQNLASGSHDTVIDHFYGIPMFCQKQFVQESTIRLQRLNSSFTMCLSWNVPVGHLVLESCTKIFPSWSWADCKARRPKDRIILYRNREDILESYADDIFEVYITHRAGERMNLLEYIQHEDDYTAFEPWIEVTSPVIQGTLCEGDEGPFMDLAWPLIHRQNLQLEEKAESLHGFLLALYLGCGEASGGLSKAYFLLLKEGPEGEYRRVGLLDAVTDRVRMDSSNWRKTFQDLFGSGDGDWQRRTLKLV